MTSSSNLSRNVNVGGVKSSATCARTERDEGDSVVTVIFIHLKETARRTRVLVHKIEKGLLTGVPPRPSEVAPWIPPHCGQDHTWKSQWVEQDTKAGDVANSLPLPSELKRYQAT
jgi:hypothetical protein